MILCVAGRRVIGGSVKPLYFGAGDVSGFPVEAVSLYFGAGEVSVSSFYIKQEKD